MYICCECGQTFDEEEVRVEKELMGEYWGENAYAETYHCPYCGADDFTEAHKCNVCGEWFEQESIEETCEECRSKLSKDLHELKNKYDMTWDDFQQFIADVFGW